MSYLANDVDILKRAGYDDLIITNIRLITGPTPAEFERGEKIQYVSPLQQ